MATAVKALDIREDIIETAAQTILAPFNINKSFYKDIIKKVKSFSKEFSKSEQGKHLKESVSGVLTDIIEKVLPTKVKPNIDIPIVESEKIEPVLEQVTAPPTAPPTKQTVATKPTTESKEQTSFFEQLKEKLFKVLNIKQATDKPKELDYFAEAQPIFLQEIAPEVYDKLADVIQNAAPKVKKEKQKEEKGIREKFSEGGLLGLLPKGLLPILGGAGLILGGLAALVGAFATQGPMKGTLELIGKVGLKGGLVMLAKKLFGATLKTALKRIPIIGTLISYGFAIQRFNNGDKIGGIIDLVSGTVQLLDLVAPGLGTVLSIGVDILQAILDAKAGGSSAEASGKKTGILLDWAKGLGSLIWKGLRYLPVIGPLFDVYDSYKKNDWAGVAVNLLRSVGQMSGVFYVIDLIDTLTGGNLKSMATEGMATMGDWIDGMSKWLYKSAKNWPIIGRLIKIGEAISAKNWAEALTQFTRIIPGTGWLFDWLGMTEEKQTQTYQQGGDMLTDLWEWMSTTMWEKVTKVMSNLVDGVKDWWNNLSWDPRSWIGMAPKGSDAQPKQKTSKATVPVNGKEMSLDKFETSQKPQTPTPVGPTPMKDGGIVTQPVTALVGEAGPEAVVPLDKYMNPTEAFDNTILEKIASNTGSTNDALKSLAQAIFKLAQTFDNKPNQAANNIFLNGQQQGPIPSASQVAAQNIDPIRQVRRQFMQFAT